jgi:hypothetical protein
MFFSVPESEKPYFVIFETVEFVLDLTAIELVSGNF